MKLKDNRYLGYGEFGDRNGFPVLFFHGLPGSRLEAAKLNTAAHELKIRLIGIDRPGMGLSSFKKNRTVVDFADDIVQLLQVLDLTKVSILGHSGGAPYVAACSYQIPQKIHKSVIVSGLAPLTSKQAIKSLPKSQKKTLWLIKYFPFILKWMMNRSLKNLDNPNNLNSMIKQLSDVDAKLLSNTQYTSQLILSLQEAIRQKGSGVITDFKLVTSSLGIELEAINCPFVIWQGGKDRQVPVKHAEIYANQLSHAHYNYLVDEGHISILQNYGRQILESAL